MKSKILFTLLFFLCGILVAEENCPFCDASIIDKQEVYRGNFWQVLLDYKPVVSGHLLIVPLEHRLTRHELSREEHDELFDIEKKVHCVFMSRFGKSIEDFQYEKNGPTLQSVHHFHIHVLPIDSTFRSSWKKMVLFTKLFIFPPSPLSDDEREHEKNELIALFQQCE